MTIAIDPQASGWQDDGTESGELRVKPVDSAMHFVPFRNGHFVTSLVGSGVITWVDDGQTTNRYGSYSGINVDLVKPAAGTSSGATITHGFYGKKYGIVFTRPYTTDAPSFTVQIDGQPVAVNQLRTYPANNTSLSFFDGTCAEAIVEDLADGWHIVDIILTPWLTGTGSGTDSVWFLYGFLAESRVGYPPESGGYVTIAGTLTASLAALPQQPNNPSVATGHNLRKFRKLRYTNTDSSARTVTIAYGGLTVVELILAAAGTAGSSAEFDPGADVAYGVRMPGAAAGWKHTADAAAKVNYALVGRP